MSAFRGGADIVLKTSPVPSEDVVRGGIQGESYPQEFIPKLVDFIVPSKMPIDRMVTFYSLAEINRAAEDSSKGKTIVPKLLTSTGPPVWNITSESSPVCSLIGSLA
jgi:Zn-dependent alcohol dehydrogenase